MTRASALLGSIVLLAAGIMGLATAAWRVWTSTPIAQATPLASVGATPASNVALGDLVLPRIDNFQQTLARPLFVEGRRPPELRPVAAPPSGPPPTVPTTAEVTIDGYRLIGVMDSGMIRKAFVETPEGRRVWVAQGQPVGSWTLASIERERVELRSGDRKGELRLYQPLGK